ncbi:MAG: response regulator [Chloroflexi bacterium]|nr:response regulator [Chloroflexota bacterium]
MAEADKKRILVVDDDPEITEMLHIILDLAGYEVRIAHGTAQGMAAVNADPPDLIVLDVMMPHLSGLELSRYVRRDPRTMRLPIVMLSALASADKVREGMEAGATAYLTKAVGRDKLLQTIEDALKAA